MREDHKQRQQQLDALLVKHKKTKEERDKLKKQCDDLLAAKDSGTASAGSTGAGGAGLLGMFGLGRRVDSTPSLSGAGASTGVAGGSENEQKLSLLVSELNAELRETKEQVSVLKEQLESANRQTVELRAEIDNLKLSAA